jgi:streptomycin 6-kinase
LKEVSISLEELGAKPKQACDVYVDNKALRDMCANPITKGVKHIDIHHRYIIQQAKKGEIKIKPVGTLYNIADIFTKQLGYDQHKRLSDMMFDDLKTDLLLAEAFGFE